MKKLQLNLDKLAVQSFEPLASGIKADTGQGQWATNASQCKSYCTFERCCTADSFDGPC